MAFCARTKILCWDKFIRENWRFFFFSNTTNNNNNKNDSYTLLCENFHGDIGDKNFLSHKRDKPKSAIYFFTSISTLSHELMSNLQIHNDDTKICHEYWAKEQPFLSQNNFFNAVESFHLKFFYLKFSDFSKINFPMPSKIFISEYFEWENSNDWILCFQSMKLKISPPQHDRDATCRIPHTTKKHDFQCAKHNKNIFTSRSTKKA